MKYAPFFISQSITRPLWDYSILYTLHWLWIKIDYRRVAPLSKGSASVGFQKRSSSGLWRKLFSKLQVFNLDVYTQLKESTLTSSIFLHHVIQGFFELHQQGTLLLPKLLFTLLSPSCADPLHVSIPRAGREICRPGLGAVVDQGTGHKHRAYPGNETSA